MHADTVYQPGISGCQSKIAEPKIVELKIVKIAELKIAEPTPLQSKPFSKFIVLA